MNWPHELMAAVKAEHERQIAAFVSITARWPAWRLHIAMGMLGGAIANVDMMGGDVEGFVAELRSKEAKPAPLVPPASEQS